MPKFDAKFQSENGLDLQDFDGFSRDWFPTGTSDAGSLTTTEIWPQQELAATDAVQRALTTSLAMNQGIPFLAGQVAAQTNFLGSLPALRSSSNIARTFRASLDSGVNVTDAFEAALSVINELGFDALQGAVGAAQNIAGVVQGVPLLGAMFALGRSYGELLWRTFEPQSSKALRVHIPAYDPGNDYNAAAIAHSISGGRDWTSTFSPADRDLGLDSGGLVLGGPAGSIPYPTFAGRPTHDDGKWVFSHWGSAFGSSFLVLPNTREHWGFVPLWGGEIYEGESGGSRPNARPGGGVLWRGAIIDRKRNNAVRLAGDGLPTAQAMGLSMWRAVNNPYAPQIFFVDAVELGRRWLNYLVQLRKGLHYSHTQRAWNTLKDLKGSSLDLGGATAARAWLSFSKVEGAVGKGTHLYKQTDMRRAVCRRLVPVFGWPEWQDGEDEMVRKLEDVDAVSDDEYIERFDLNNAAPVVACRELFKRQVEAAQSVTVLYSRDDDPAFRSHAGLRQLRDRGIQQAINVPRLRGAADADMISPGLIQQAGQQLWDPNAAVAEFDPARKSQIYRIDDVWAGDGPAPREWAGRDNTSELPVMQLAKINGPGTGGGGGAGIVLLGLGAVGVYAYTRGRR